MFSQKRQNNLIYALKTKKRGESNEFQTWISQFFKSVFPQKRQKQKNTISDLISSYFED